jgi:hypothetical protein
MIATLEPSGRVVDYCRWLFVREKDGTPIVVGKAHGPTWSECQQRAKAAADFIYHSYQVDISGFDLLAPTFKDGEAIRALGKFTR